MSIIEQMLKKDNDLETTQIALQAANAKLVTTTAKLEASQALNGQLQGQVMF